MGKEGLGGIGVVVEKYFFNTHSFNTKNCGKGMLGKNKCGLDEVVVAPSLLGKSWLWHSLFQHTTDVQHG